MVVKITREAIKTEVLYAKWGVVTAREEGVTLQKVALGTSIR